MHLFISEEKHLEFLSSKLYPETLFYKPQGTPNIAKSTWESVGTKWMLSSNKQNKSLFTAMDNLPLKILNDK